MTSDIALSGARAGLPRLDFELPELIKRSEQPRRSRASAPAGVALYAAAATLALRNESFRHVEARMITPAASLVTGGHGSVSARTIVYFALGTSRAFGLDVTNECTSALLLIPLFVMMGSFATFTRIPLHRQLVAVATGTVLILITNVLRVAGIAWATWKFGYDPGYTYSHVFVGSAFSLGGFVGAMLVALWLLVRAQRGHTPAAAAAQGLRQSPRVLADRAVRARPRPNAVCRPRPRPGTGRPRPGPGS